MNKLFIVTTKKEVDAMKKGRPVVTDTNRRELITIRLPRWLIDKLRLDGDVGKSIENALTEHILAEATPREACRKVELIKKAVLDEIIIEES
jgi:uncharacterized protein (DUF4415 family)